MKHLFRNISIMVELNDTFLSKTLSMMTSISNVYSESENFLNVDGDDEFVLHIEAEWSTFKNKFVILKSMFDSKNTKNIFELFAKMIPLCNAFP